MKEYKRDYPLFSLCGLNCGLCPRHQTSGVSKCPGCGGQDFHLKHPACSVITCSQRHDNVQYCFQCSIYPCAKYAAPSSVDSFISYRNVLTDMARAKNDLAQYKAELDEKVGILEFLINNYDDGRRKSFYCNAVNLISLTDLRDIISEISDNVSKLDITLKEKIERIVLLLEAKAGDAKIELKLRR